MRLAICVASFDNIGTSPDNIIAQKIVEDLNSGEITINEVEPRNELLVYPNPATDQITVVFANQTAWESIMITDVSGKVVYTTPVNNDQITISVNGLEAGIYFITSISKSETAVQKLVVQ